jgi:hypothetical protein
VTSTLHDLALAWHPVLSSSFPLLSSFLSLDVTYTPNTADSVTRTPATGRDTTTRINTEIFAGILTEITGIPAKVLRGELVIRLVPAAQKMAWAAKRLTTREEDLAYALMGLFGVSMPILYGEGLERAFRRLQLEIIQTNTDQSIFVWRSKRWTSGLLADSPKNFAESGLDFVWRTTTLQPYSMTNLGLALNLPVVHRRDGNHHVAFLRCCK